MADVLLVYPSFFRIVRALVFFFTILVFQIGAPAVAYSAAASPDVLNLNEAAELLRVEPAELERLATRNELPARRIGTLWRFNRAALMAWLNGDWGVITVAEARSGNKGPRPGFPEQQVGSTGAQPILLPHELKSVIGGGSRVAQAPAGQVKSGQADSNDKPIGNAPEERKAEDVFLRSQKVLLAPGETAVEVGQFFSRADDKQLALVGGGVSLATLEQKTFTTLLLGRIGVFDETELFASSTFRHQDSELMAGGSTVSESHRSEFGDLRLGVRHTLVKEGPGRPNIIATLDGRIPTGDTSYALGGGIAFVKSIDPVVLFANANYRHTFSRDFADVTRLEPEDRYDLTMGYALALNDTLTVSTSASAVFSGESRFSNATLRSQDSYSLSFGLTSWLAKGLYIEPTVSFGLSGTGNSVAFGVTAPYTF